VAIVDFAVEDSNLINSLLGIQTDLNKFTQTNYGVPEVFKRFCHIAMYRDRFEPGLLVYL
jgi:hypothetical protein